MFMHDFLFALKLSGGLAWGSLGKPRKGSGPSNCLADLPAMPPGATSFEVVPIARWGFGCYLLHKNIPIMTAKNVY